MQHFFDTNVAAAYGMLEATIVANLDFWIGKNRANGVNYFDGRYWTYNSNSAFAELFPYATKSQIRRALEKLRAKGIIMTGNYSKDAHSRTLWYAFTDKGEQMLRNPEAFFNAPADKEAGEADERQGDVSQMANACVTGDKCMCHQQQMDVSDLTNGCVTGDKCIKTDNKQQIVNTDSKPDSKRVGASSPKTRPLAFVPPTVEEVAAYCMERSNSVNPAAFVAHYESNGWMVGKTRMKNWQAAVRTWEHNNVGSSGGKTIRGASVPVPEYIRRPEHGSGRVDPGKLDEYRRMVSSGELTG